MTLRVPLAVRIGDRHYTRQLSDLSFRSVVPGGFASAQMTLSQPLSVADLGLRAFQDVVITDTRSGQTVWEGRLEDPGRGIGSAGEVWSLNALGPSAYARDRSWPYISVDRSLEPYYRTGGTIPSGTVTTTQYSLDEEVPALQLQVPNGAAIPTNAIMRVRYSLLRECQQFLARYDYIHVEGAINTSWRVQIQLRDSVGGTVVDRDDQFHTGQDGSDARFHGTDFASDTDIFEPLIKWTGASANVGSDTIWTHIAGLYVMAQRYDKTGAVVAAAGYPDHNVIASDVAVDIGVRFMSGVWDMAGASVTASTALIDQFAYWDATTPAQMLDDLLGFEPTFYWAAWEKTSSGKYGFQFITWPTVPRWELDPYEGFDAQGQGDRLINEVIIRWRNQRGSISHYHATSAVDELDDAGIVRNAYIDLSEVAGSAGNVVTRAQAELADGAVAPMAGTVTTSKPVVDHQLGTWIDPHMVRPGYLVRIRSVDTRASTLDAAERDGRSVARVVATNYTASTGAVTLELDTPTRSLARQMAVARAVTRRRR